ncbi:hypothetical protein H5410_006737 [Solanum commersonii]|uniref:Uncharacterized protein n=1 Tax=Solanum commersonii TaxID=4109 RepID=A0A9J6AC63_SOLCO|nr:hypothetical protein H5410_006737 [Solanum commersonii]
MARFGFIDAHFYGFDISKAFEKDLKCIFTIIYNLFKKPESLDLVHKMAELISITLSQQPSDKPAFCLKCIMS